MNNRRFTWLPLMLGLLVSSHPLAAQFPTNPNPPGNLAPNSTIPVEQPAGTFFYSDLAPPANTTQVPQSAQQPVPPMPAGTLFYSDLQSPTNFANSPTQLQAPRQLPLAPQPDEVGSRVNLKQPLNRTKLAPYPTNVAPVLPPRFDTIGPRRPVTSQSPYRLERPAILTTTSRLFNQEDIGSPSDQSLTPAQKGCSKWCRTWNIWGEFLYLRSRDSEVTYGVETNTAVGACNQNCFCCSLLRLSNRNRRKNCDRCNAH